MDLVEPNDIRVPPFSDSNSRSLPLDNRDRRKPVTVTATCISTGVRERVIVSDICGKGCKIEAAEMLLQPNQDLVLQFDGLEDLSGTVRWARERCAGVELDHALHPSVVGHLFRTNPHTVDRCIPPRAG